MLAAAGNKSAVLQALETQPRQTCSHGMLVYRGAQKDWLSTVCTQMHVAAEQLAFAAAGQMQCWSRQFLLRSELRGKPVLTLVWSKTVLAKAGNRLLRNMHEALKDARQ